MSALQKTLENFIERWRYRRREAARRPEVLRKYYQWESVSGKRVRVYYVPPKADLQEIKRIVEGCDETQKQIGELLGIKISRRRVSIFLYPDDHSFRRCEQIQGRPRFSGITRGNNISLPYEMWSSIAKTLAHELTHVISRRYCGKPSLRLLEEGLAMYVDNQLYPDTEKGFIPQLDLPLHQLANPEILGKFMDDYMRCSEAYAYAHVFGTYLIDRYGMAAFLCLLKASASRKWQKREKRFIVALQRIYGLTVEDLEHQWRQESACSLIGSLCRIKQTESGPGW